uniref:Uncharacterized protein n=1 Tax=Peronospora matthiolae TaxID=2874970 RepID=A0AAV1U1D4_9STRA
MNLLICLVLTAVATTTTYGQAPAGAAAGAAARSNELLDGLKLLSDLVTDKDSKVVYGHHHVRGD